MKTINTVASSVGRGLVAGFAGTAAMTLSSTLEAKLRGRAPSSAPARATAKALGITEFEDDIARARFNDLSHWGYGTGWGVLRGLLAATGMSPKAASALHGAAIYGAAQVTLPALDVAPPAIFWPKQEIAIDAFTSPSMPRRRERPTSCSSTGATERRLCGRRRSRRRPAASDAMLAYARFAPTWSMSRPPTASGGSRKEAELVAALRRRARLRGARGSFHSTMFAVARGYAKTRATAEEVVQGVVARGARRHRPLRTALLASHLILRILLLTAMKRGKRERACRSHRLRSRPRATSRRSSPSDSAAAPTPSPATGGPTPATGARCPKNG